MSDSVDDAELRQACREMLDDNWKFMQIVKRLVEKGAGISQAKEIVLQEQGVAGSLEEHQEWIADELEKFIERDEEQ